MKNFEYSVVPRQIRKPLKNMHPLDVAKNAETYSPPNAVVPDLWEEAKEYDQPPKI